MSEKSMAYGCLSVQQFAQIGSDKAFCWAEQSACRDSVDTGLYIRTCMAVHAQFEVKILEIYSNVLIRQHK